MFIDAFAPVHLPTNAIVTGFRISTYDISSDWNALVWFQRASKFDGSIDTLAFAESVTVGFRFSSDVDGISFPQIDNQLYAYHIAANSLGWPDASVEIMGATITYTTTTAR